MSPAEGCRPGRPRPFAFGESRGAELPGIGHAAGGGQQGVIPEPFDGLAHRVKLEIPPKPQVDQPGSQPFDRKLP